MICEKNSCRQIVDRLVIDFWSSNEKNLKNKEGTVTQDFISRGLHNSTMRITELLSLNCKYLQNLMNELLVCLEKDYPDISPTKFQPELIRVVETEYSRLNTKIGRWLMESMLPNQLNALQQGLNTQKLKAKNDIENKCALWMERWTRRRKERQWKIVKWVIEKVVIGTAIGVTIGIIVGILVPQLNKYFERKDNPAVQAPRMPQIPHKSSVRPNVNQTKQVPVKIRKPQLEAVNEPNKGGYGQIPGKNAGKSFQISILSDN